MKKILMGSAAMLALTATWMATAGTNINQAQPQAQAYIRLPFGGDAHAPREPFHYGLRLDYDSRTRALAGRDVPALANFDFDNRGNRLAFLGGVPFAGRLVNSPLHAAEGDTTSGGSGSGGFTFFDWGLLAVGAGGLGYAVYKVTEDKNSPTPTTTSTGGGGILGGNPLPLPVPSPAPGGFVDQNPPVSLSEDQQHQHWLDAGTGHMGDLNPR